MAWGWSHTAEAYQNAREQVDTLPRRELLTILREWAYQDRQDRGTLRTRHGAKRIAGFRLPAGIRRLPIDVLADLVWDRAEQHRTCPDGGWQAYVCPDGCHTVPFDPVKGSDHEA